MNQWKEQLVRLQEAIDGRVLRERVLLLLTVLAVLLMVWSLFVQAPVDKQRSKLKGDVELIASERKKLETDIANLTMAAANSPAVLKQKEIRALKQRINEVEAQLSNMSQGLISADQLPRILQEILSPLSRVEVLGVKTLPARQLQLPGIAPAATASASADAGVYQHMVVLRIRGSYFELLALLKQLESLSWKFYWDSLNYRVDTYPAAEIEVRVFTLSSEEGLLGV